MRFGTRIRGLGGVVATALALASLLLLVVPVGAQADSGQTFLIQPEGTVNWSDLPPAEFDGNRPVHIVRPNRLPRDFAEHQRAKAAANAGAAQGAAAPDVAGPLNVNVVSSFIGLKFSESGGFLPPDNGTAVGPTHVFEMVNVVGAIYLKSTGVKVGANKVLGTFFGTGAQGLSDPIIRYDPTSNRWFAAIITVNNSLKWVLAVSTSSDPTSTWVLYSFTPSPSNCTDYPNMGISDDKVVLTANAFSPNCSIGTFSGAEFVVFNKAQLVAGTAAAAQFFAPDPGAFTFRAAQNLSSDNNIYMVSHSGASNPTSMRVYTVVGVPTATFSSVTGTILVNGTGQSGRTVNLKVGPTTIQTTTTVGGGAYTFSGVAGGTYNVQILGVTNSNVGTVPYSGNISVNAVGQNNRKVKVSGVVGTVLTSGGGNFNSPSVPAGTHKVTIKKLVVTGSTSGVTKSFVDRTISALSVPPGAEQSGGLPLIETNDNRLLDASFRNGSLFTTAGTGCTPAGDVTLRACVRVIQVLNPAVTATINQDFNFGIAGIHMYFPALTITSNNDVISVFSRSSTAEFAGVWASGRISTDTANTYRTPTLIKAGEAHYSPSFSRWGDYSSVAIDPSDQTKAWVSGEYACPGGCGIGSNWGTWIGQTEIVP
jgi:hypothetical protein